MDMQGADIVIVEVVLAGDVDAFEEIIDRYSSMLRRYICRIGITPPSDEDVLQEAFLKIYQNLNSFNKSYKFSSWAYRITRNEAVSYHRRNKKHALCNDRQYEQFWEGVLDEHDMITAIIDTESELARQAIRKKLPEVIRALNTKYSEPLVLHFFENKQYKEIADILRVPTSTVGTRIRRAKEKIRLLLDEKNTDIL